MSDEPQAEYEIGEATVEEVRPLRSRYLRPDQPEEAVVYRSDEEETARHYAARAPDGRILAVAKDSSTVLTDSEIDEIIRGE